MSIFANTINVTFLVIISLSLCVLAPSSANAECACTGDQLLEQQLKTLLGGSFTADQLQNYKLGMQAQAKYFANNKIPIAKITACTCTGFDCQVIGSDSFDAEDQNKLAFEWKVNNTNIDAKEDILSYEFTKSGKNQVTLTVTDAGGLTSTDNYDCIVESPTSPSTSNCIGETKKGKKFTCVSEKEEKGGKFDGDLYIPTFAQKQIIVYSSKGAVEAYYPGCAGKNPPPLPNDPCRYKDSLDPRIIYSQRLIVNNGNAAQNPIDFDPSYASEVSTFDKSISWMPGDLNARDPSLFSGVEKDNKWWEQAITEDKNNQCKSSTAMSLRFYESTIPIPACDIIQKIKEKEAFAITQNIITSQETITLAKSTTEEDITLTGSITIKGDTYVNGDKIPTGTVIEKGTIIKKGTTIPKGSYILTTTTMSDMVASQDTITLADIKTVTDITLKEPITLGSTLYAIGDIIPKETLIPTGTIIVKGNTIPKGTRILTNELKGTRVIYANFRVAGLEGDKCGNGLNCYMRLVAW